jgi:hypothetical protein
MKSDASYWRLHYALSKNDGQTWNLLNFGNEIATQSPQYRGHPYIIRRANNNGFLMVGNYQTKKFFDDNNDTNYRHFPELWESNDLVNWKLIKVLDETNINYSLKAQGDIGAPKIIWVASESNYILTYHTSDTDELMYDNSGNHNPAYWAGMDIYYLKLDINLNPITSPQKLFPINDNRFDFPKIDLILQDLNGKLQVYFKNEASKKIIHTSLSHTLNQSTFSNPMEVSAYGHEAPTVYYSSDLNKNFLFYEENPGLAFRKSTSTDLYNWIITPLSQNHHTLLTGLRHGSMITITDQEMEKLESEFNKSKEVLSTETNLINNILMH